MVDSSNPLQGNIACSQ